MLLLKAFSRAATDNICLTLMTSFPLQLSRFARSFRLQFASPIRSSPSLEIAIAPPPPRRTDRLRRRRSNSLAANAGDHLRPETKPCPPPSSDGRRRVRIPAGTRDGMDGLLGNVDSQRRYAAHLNAGTNASCESFMKTLKREEIYANKYEDLENLRANIEEFIEQYYNRLRLHSALGYRSPEEFEQKTESQAESRSATMEFFENKENSKKNSKGLLGRGGGERGRSPTPPPPLPLRPPPTLQQQ